MPKAKSPVAVPAYDLDSSIETARKITDDGHGAELSVDVLASRLGYSKPTNGSFIRRRAAAQAFGLIEGRGRLKATERAYRIIFPQDPASEAAARLEAFRSIPVFNDFFTAFKGQKLPDDQGAANTLISRWHVPQADAKAVYRRLKLSAEQAWLFRESPDRMLEPAGSAITNGGGESDTQDEAVSEPSKVTRDKETPPAAENANRFALILEGPLQMLPDKQAWTEPELVQWLQFFEMALRVYYKLPKGQTLPSGLADK